MATELERTREDFTQLIHAVSHDFAEPLQIVLSYAELLGSHSAGRLDEKGERYLAGIQTGAGRIRELLDGLTSLSQLERHPPELVEVASSQILEVVLEELAGPIAETEATVTAESLPTITCDPLELGRVFQSLLDNAIKFRVDDPPVISIWATEERGEWLFSVRDSGIGIDPRRREEVFDIFRRLHPRAQYPGTGVGLAVCRKIVERHGGRIWVESEDGAGSTFHFTIPRLDAHVSSRG